MTRRPTWREVARFGVLELRAHAMTVACPDESCGAGAGEPCRHSDGVPLGKAPAHGNRIREADRAEEQT